jgi:CRP/FNR family cyclic AMP-dependent transcriptional regulator
LASTTSEPDVHAALAGVELLAGLDEQSLRRLASRGRRRSWRAGDVLFAQGMPGGSLLVLTSGAVTVYRLTTGGDRAALAHLRAPASVGEVTLLDGSPRTATVEAVEQTEALELDRDDLLELLRTQPAFLDALLRSLGGLVRRLSDQTADHILLDFAGRVAKTLAGLAGPPPGPHVVRLSQSRLAELAGGTRQSLNQVLGAFATRGWVRVEGRSVVVEDVAAVRRRAGLRP